MEITDLHDAETLQIRMQTGDREIQFVDTVLVALDEHTVANCGRRSSDCGGPRESQPVAAALRMCARQLPSQESASQSDADTKRRQENPEISGRDHPRAQNNGNARAAVNQARPHENNGAQRYRPQKDQAGERCQIARPRPVRPPLRQPGAGSQDLKYEQQGRDVFDCAAIMIRLYQSCFDCSGESAGAAVSAISQFCATTASAAHTAVSALSTRGPREIPRHPAEAKLRALGICPPAFGADQKCRGFFTFGTECP